MPQNSFPCSGTIHTIKYYASSASSTSLSVWRLDEDGLFANLAHTVILSPPDKGVQQYHLNKTLAVQGGDFIGVGSFGASDTLPVPIAQQGQIGVLTSELQTVYLIDTHYSHIENKQRISLNFTGGLQRVLALNIQYIPVGHQQGRKHH